MSEHDIADCPKCGKRDFVLKEDGYWVCLNCSYTQKMPTSKSESGAQSDVVSVILAALTAVLFVMLALGI